MNPKYIFLLLGLAIILCLNSCAIDRYAQFSIDQRNENPSRDFTGATYDFGVYNGQINDRRYYPIKKAVSEVLDKKKMRRINSGQVPNNHADYTVILLYGLTGSSNKERNVAEWSVTNAGGYNTYSGNARLYSKSGNYVGSTPFSTTVYSAPTVDITGHHTVAYTEYYHRIMIVIKDKNWRTVYTATAESKSRLMDINQFSYKMTKELLDNFPKNRHTGFSRAVLIN